MRKWLIGLAVAGGAGIAALVASRIRLRMKHSDFHRAIEFAEAFLEQMGSGVDGVSNETKMLPGKGAWVDTYEGTVGTDTFTFEALQFGEPDSIAEDKPKHYLLRWRIMLVQISVSQEQEDGPSSVYPRIHQELRRRYRLSRSN